MTRILVSAYSCEPGKGSEPGAGYALVRAAATVGPCWVITRLNNVRSLEAAFDASPTPFPVTVVGLDGPPWSLALKRRFGAVRTYYSFWQSLARRRAARLDAEVAGFDVVHHATMSAFWLPIGIVGVRRPQVVGPISGGTFTPRRLLGYLGIRGVLEDGVRFLSAHLSAPLARRRLRTASVVIAQNHQMEQFARRRLGVGDDRLMRHSHASSPEVSVPSGRRARERTVLFVGRLVTWKGVALAIDAFAAARLPDTKFVVIGQGPALGAMKDRAEAAGIAGSVTFTGPIPRVEVIEHMGRASCLLFPSFHDSAGFVVSEALTLGLPVVCLDHGGPGELVGLWDGDGSHAVRPGGPAETVRALADAITDFVESPRSIPQAPVAPNSDLSEFIRQAYTRAVEGALS